MLRFSLTEDPDILKLKHILDLFPNKSMPHRISGGPITQFYRTILV